MACGDLGQAAHDAEVIDSAREFAKTTTLVFGISFSAVLAAMYVPAMLLLKRAADEYTAVIAGGAPLSKAQQAAEYVALGIESDMLGKLGKVITALSPIFAGVIANALGSI